MNKNLVIGILVAIGLSACTRKVDHNEKSQETGLFKSDYDTLKQIELPVLYTWDTWSEQVAGHHERYGVGQGWELSKHPFGKLIDTINYKGIIFISTDETGSPTLITIGRNQNPIDTLFILGDMGSNDPGIKTIEQGSIDNNLVIQLVDSVFTYDVGDAGNRINTTEKLTIKTEKYRIENTGHIKKIE